MLSDSVKTAVCAAPIPPFAPVLRGPGFTGCEARACTVPAARQPVTACGIANRAGPGRGNVRSALRAPGAKGAIQPVADTPLRDVTVNHDQFFRGIQRSSAGLCGNAIREIKRMAHDEAGSAHVLLLRGGGEVRLRLREMIEAARDHVWTRGIVAPMAPPPDPRSRRASAAGLRRKYRLRGRSRPVIDGSEPGAS